MLSGSQPISHLAATHQVSRKFIYQQGDRAQLDVMAQGFNPEYTIADGGSGLRAGQKTVMPAVPCHGDIFHIQQQFEQVANGLARQAQEATTRRIKLEEKIAQAKLNPQLTATQLLLSAPQPG